MNILTKLNRDAWTRYEEDILSLPLIRAPIATSTELELASVIAGEKDAHVLAAATAVNASYLVTFDRRLAERINYAALLIGGLTPGGLIELARAQDPDYFLAVD
jgi:predicted nucleic acid-binding protein